MNTKRCGKRAHGWLRLWDAAVIVIITVLSFSSFLLIPEQCGSVVVLWHGEKLYEGTLDTDAEIITPDGHNIITVSGGCAYMSYAECADLTCVHMGNALAGRPVVCLPNRVIIIITDEMGVDSVTW